MTRLWVSDYRLGEQNSGTLGGKGLNLFKLMQQGVPVPEFGIISTAAFDQWLALGKVLSESLLEEVKQSIRTWNCSYVAIRSSMTSEDGHAQSYAGMMETFLYVAPEDIGPMIERCFASMSTDRVLAYEATVGKRQGMQRAAVVVQKMVDAEVSGVAFSRAPMGDSALIHIEAGLGLGEGVVSGSVDVDTFSMDRFYQLVHSRVIPKAKALRFDPEANQGARLKEFEVHLEHGAKPALSLDQLKSLTRIILKLEKEFGFPVDIEWAFTAPTIAQKDGSLYLLQVRPITLPFKPLTYFIDTNLSESYPGFSSPFTSSFVRVGYTKTFIEVFAYLGMSHERMNLLKPHLTDLVTNLGGHMYYNLTSYYTVLGALPGGKSNIERWHQMIGGAFAEQSSIMAVPALTVMETVRSYLSLLKMYILHDRIFTNFYTYAEKNRQSLLTMLNSTQTSQDAAKFFNHAIASTHGFGLTALNDFLIMILIKLLMNLLERCQIPTTELSSLIKTDHGVDSLEPLRDLEQMVAKIPDPSVFFKIFQDFVTSHTAFEWEFKSLYQLLYRHLENKGYATVAANIAAYLEKFGQRSFEELKIESLTLEQSPALLLELMTFIHNQPKGIGKVVVPAAKPFNVKSIGPFWGRVCQFLLHFAHKTIVTREKTRLIRGQYFGIIREAMLRFVQLSRQEQPELLANLRVKDFFALDLETLSKFGAQSLDWKVLNTKLQAYANQPQARKDFPEFVAMAEGDIQPSFPDPHGLSEAVVSPGSSLQGLGASRGTIEGEVLRIESPDQALLEKDLSCKILVTRTTDPAWVFIMSQCCGLVSEKGSLLSHTAIIGREMGIPTVVGASGIFARLQTGQRIRINGETGCIEILDLICENR
jgi:pyruvate,water dikinase